MSENNSFDPSQTSCSTIKRKKGIKGKDYRCEVIKKARVQGLPYINNSDNLVRARTMGPDCNCRRKCFSNINEALRLESFLKFYEFTSKNEQDAYLQSLISCVPIERRRSRISSEEETAKPRASNFSFSINTSKGTVKVCKKAFLSIHAISKDRVYRLCKLLMEGKQPRDLRGLNQSGNAKPQHVAVAVRAHISSFPVKEAHYTSRQYFYLSEKLNLKTMFEMFKTMHPEINISKSYYIRYFHNNFSLSFGRPQVDTCGEFELLSVKMKNKNLNENARRAAIAEKIIHLRRAKKFNVKLQEVTKMCETNDDVYGICIDYMQNLQLPHIPVQDIFYLRQLVVAVFCVHDLKTGKAVFYVYHEGQGTKSPDEVCSFLKHYIDNFVPPTVKSFYMFSDGCSPQNKNHTVARFFLALASTERFTTVKNYYPLRGHSYNPCDRDFSVLKRKIKTVDRIYTVKEYVNLILSSSAANKFIVVMVSAEMIFDFKKWWPPLYKRKVISQETKGKNVKKEDKVSLLISKYMEFRYTSNSKGIIEALPYIDGLVVSTFNVTTANAANVTFDNLKLSYPSLMIPINSKKMEDLKKVRKYLVKEKSVQLFWRKIYCWPISDKDLPEISTFDD